MREQLIQYVNLLFAGSPDYDDMKQEILQNTLERFDDLVAQGKTPEAAYRLAISGIGDINEVLGSDAPSPAPRPAPAPAGDAKEKRSKSWMQAVAIAMYICCVIPVIALGGIGDGIIGVCLMFLLIASATVLMVIASDDEEENKKSRETPLNKALNTVALVLFFVLSFSTGAWHITWLVFPIMAAVRGIVNACLDLKKERNP